MIEHYEVAAGDNFYVIADKVAPDADRDVAAEYLWRANGYPPVVYEDQVVHYNPDAAELAPIVVEPPASAAVWLEVQPGPGSMANARRVVVPDESVYPVGGVDLYLNGTLNRNDPTGRLEGSEFHTYPPVDLVAGDVLRAEWVDADGVSHASEHMVIGDADEPPAAEPPAAEPPVDEPPVEEPPAEPPPEPGDRPNSSNTGHDGNLTRTFGSTTIDQAWLDANNGGSRVVENVRFTGGVRVAVDDLTIRNFEITGGTYGVDNGVLTGSPTTGLVLEDGELTRQESTGVLASNFVARRLHVHDQGADAFKPFSNYVIEDCYAHHLGYIVGSHADGVQMVNGSNGVIRRNHFDMARDGSQPGYNNSQVLIIQTGNGPINGVIIDANWINGGGYSVYVTDKGNGHGYPKNVEVTNNRFGRGYAFGLFSFKDGTPDVVSGNVWDDTGEPV